MFFFSQLKQLNNEKVELENQKKDFEEKAKRPDNTEQDKEAYENAAHRFASDLQDLDEEIISKQVIQSGQCKRDLLYCCQYMTCTKLFLLLISLYER
jgi:hypothetical protein